MSSTSLYLTLALMFGVHKEPYPHFMSYSTFIQASVWLAVDAPWIFSQLSLLIIHHKRETNSLIDKLKKKNMKKIFDVGYRGWIQASRSLKRSWYLQSGFFPATGWTVSSTEPSILFQLKSAHTWIFLQINISLCVWALHPHVGSDLVHQKCTILTIFICGDTSHSSFAHSHCFFVLNVMLHNNSQYHLSLIFRLAIACFTTLCCCFLI